jgi:rhamnose utilization protein RhaD (predicted bifunctional aldolase and dehydrogenase)
MPGFGLAQKSIAMYERDRPSDGLILSKHGIVTFGDTARQAYERMIEMISLAEAHIARNRKSAVAAAVARSDVAVAEIAPIVRGACSQKDDKTEGAWTRLVADFRGGEAVLKFIAGRDLTRLSESGVITPDHTIRTKNWPLLVPTPEPAKLGDFAGAVRQRAEVFAARYRDYFHRHNARVGGGKKELDPLPRVVLVPGTGLFGLGRSKRDAMVAADIAEA